MFKVKEKSNVWSHKSLIPAIEQSNSIIDSEVYDSHDFLIYQQNKGIQTVYIGEYPFKIDPSTNRYTSMGINLYPDAKAPTDLEYHTGAYNYLISKGLYQTLKATFSFKESIIHLSNDDSVWNGYVLFNHQSVDQIDVGVSLSYTNRQVIVRPFYFYMGAKYQRQFYIDPMVLSTFKQVDEDTFIGIDSFTVVFNKTAHGWYFKITNIDKNLNFEKQIELNNIHEGQTIDRFLVGASLVPVGKTLWHPLSNASFVNVKFESVILNGHDYLYPGSKTMHSGYAQGHPFAYYKQSGIEFTFSTNYKLNE